MFWFPTPSRAAWVPVQGDPVSAHGPEGLWAHKPLLGRSHRVSPTCRLHQLFTAAGQVLWEVARGCAQGPSPPAQSGGAPVIPCPLLLSIQETKALSSALPGGGAMARPQHWPPPPAGSGIPVLPPPPQASGPGAATHPASLRPQGPAARATPSACWTRSCSAWVRPVGSFGASRASARRGAGARRPEGTLHA